VLLPRWRQSYDAHSDVHTKLAAGPVLVKGVRRLAGRLLSSFPTCIHQRRSVKTGWKAMDTTYILHTSAVHAREVQLACVPHRWCPKRSTLPSYAAEWKSSSMSCSAPGP